MDDQASGLRRLFARKRQRVITFAAGSVGVGRTVIVANLAAALARQGKDVLVIDENAENSIAAQFGALARNDLSQVINGDKNLADVLLTVAPGVRVLPAARAVKRLGKLSPRQQNALCESIVGMPHPVDLILVDASLDHPLGFSPLGLAAHETVVVMSATGASITEAYALIKKVSLGYSRKDFRILVNRVKNGDEAESVYRNIAQVAHSRGVAELSFAGHIPMDEYVRQSGSLSQPVVALYADTPASRSFRAMASALADWDSAYPEMGGLEQFVQHLLHLSQHIDPVPIYA